MSNPYFFAYGIPATSMRGHGASLLKTLLRFFFRLLYHQFAFTYDLVAATVSFNRWKDWVMSVIPFLEGNRILEIGHGPGHLQRILFSQGRVAVGIDESRQMGHLARYNLTRGKPSRISSTSPRQPADTQGNLTRGLAQHLPFPGETFNSVVATFPAEYIFDPQTLAEARRVLVPGGRFIILPGAIITGRGVVDRVLAWVFRITGETPPDLPRIVHERSKKPFIEAGFQIETQEVALRTSLVFILLATKSKVIEEEPHA